MAETGDGNAALLFDLHPVGGGVPRGLAGLYGAGLADGAAVEQQFFRQRGFTSVRMRNDGKGSAAGSLLRQFRMLHQHIPPEYNSTYIVYTTDSRLSTRERR